MISGEESALPMEKSSRSKSREFKEDDQENEKEDEREDGKQRVDGRVVENQATHNMQMTHV